MEMTYKQQDIEQILAEADDLLRQLDPEIVEQMEEEKRTQLEHHAQRLKRLKSEVQEKFAMEGTPEDKSYSGGMHEAIEDIVKATKALASYLS